MDEFIAVAIGLTVGIGLMTAIFVVSYPSLVFSEGYANQLENFCEENGYFDYDDDKEDDGEDYYIDYCIKRTKDSIVRTKVIAEKSYGYTFYIDGEETFSR